MPEASKLGRKTGRSGSLDLPSLNSLSELRGEGGRSRSSTIDSAELDPLLGEQLAALGLHRRPGGGALTTHAVLLNVSRRLFYAYSS